MLKTHAFSLPVIKLVEQKNVEGTNICRFLFTHTLTNYFKILYSQTNIKKTTHFKRNMGLVTTFVLCISIENYDIHIIAYYSAT